MLENVDRELRVKIWEAHPGPLIESTMKEIRAFLDAPEYRSVLFDMRWQSEDVAEWLVVWGVSD